ncbi:MAG: TIGR03546 family protein [Proteobacteria bacterium]|nr:TIGR03546 family protein [Pseudomonadota bacterium]MBU1739767.1 TIGR03546 family protein [Pseudomonadota bacterium]
MLKLIARFLKVLNSDAEPGQISLAFCFAMVAGLTPLASPHNILVLFLVCILRANLSTFLLGLLVFTGIAYLLDPLFNLIGIALLTMGPLNSLWTALYNTTLFRLENFNNSIVMGSLAFSVVLFAPMYFLSSLLVVRYRDHVLRWVERSRLMKFFMASKLYTLYKSITGMGGAA